MKKYFLMVWTGIVLLLMLFSVPAHAFIEHGAESIAARVVDAKSGQPLEGVIVVAHWQLERKVWAGIGHSGRDPRGPLQLKIMETVTDGNGRFFFPAWGPLPTPPNSYLEGFDPRIIMFKQGYEYYVAANLGFPPPINPNVSSTRTSWINGTTIKLKKFEGDLKDYAEEITLLHGRVDFAIDPGSPNCDWTQIPRMLSAMHKQKRIFQNAKVYSSLPTIDDIPFQDQCGSARELLKEYLGYQESPPDNPPKAVPNQSRHAPQPQMMYGPTEGFVPPKSK